MATEDPDKTKRSSLQPEQDSSDESIKEDNQNENTNDTSNEAPRAESDKEEDGTATNKEAHSSAQIEDKEEKELPVIQVETSPTVQEGLDSEGGVLLVDEDSPVEDGSVPLASDEQKQIELEGEAQLLIEDGPKEEQVASRIKRKEEQRLLEEEGKERHSYPYKRERIRLIPIWLRLIIIVVLGGAALMAGLIIGFGVIGNGDNAWDVLNPELWYAIIDTIRGD